MANKEKKKNLDDYCKEYGLSEQDKKDLRNACSEYVVVELKNQFNDKKLKSAWNWLNAKGEENQFSYDITLRKLRQMKEDYPKLKQVKDKEGKAIDIDIAYEDEVDNYCIQIIVLTTQSRVQTKFQQDFAKKYSLDNKIIAKLNNDTLLNYTIKQIHYRTLARKTRILLEKSRKLYNSDVNKKINDLLNTDLALEDQDNNEEKQKNPSESNEIPIRYLAKRLGIEYRDAKGLLEKIKKADPQVAIDFKNFAIEQFYEKLYLTIEIEIITQLKKDLSGISEREYRIKVIDKITKNQLNQQKSEKVRDNIRAQIIKEMEDDKAYGNNLRQILDEYEGKRARQLERERTRLSDEINQLEQENTYLFRSGRYVEGENLEASNIQSDMPPEIHVEQGSKINTPYISTSKSPLIMLTYNSSYKESDSQADTTRHSKYLAINLNTLLSDLTKRLDEINSQRLYDQEYKLYIAIEVYLKYLEVDLNKKLSKELNEETLKELDFYCKYSNLNVKLYDKIRNIIDRTSFLRYERDLSLPTGIDDVSTRDSINPLINFTNYLLNGETNNNENNSDNTVNDKNKNNNRTALNYGPASAEILFAECIPANAVTEIDPLIVDVLTVSNKISYPSQFGNLIEKICNDKSILEKAKTLIKNDDGFTSDELYFFIQYYMNNQTIETIFKERLYNK